MLPVYTMLSRVLKKECYVTKFSSKSTTLCVCVCVCVEGRMRLAAAARSIYKAPENPCNPSNLLETCTFDTTTTSTQTMTYTAFEVLDHNTQHTNAPIQKNELQTLEA